VASVLGACHFFFSSRRRHTRFSRDWSSDVCSSDLPLNSIIGMVNGFISGLNKIKLPDWLPGVGGKGINISKIPMLATGGNVFGRSEERRVGKEWRSGRGAKQSNKTRVGRRARR